jgi:hypothetical protein
MPSYPWNAPTSRTSGIATVDNLSNAAGYLGSEIDNSSNLDDTVDIQLAATPAATPTVNVVAYVYILKCIDGTNYEDGGTSTQPKGVPVAVMPFAASTSAQKIAFTGIPIPPQKFKILVWNSTGVELDAITVLIETYRMGYAA